MPKIEFGRIASLALIATAVAVGSRSSRVGTRCEKGT
jgi:hypothetical protein